MTPWSFLIIAGLFEVAWLVLLKLTDGFTRLLPSAATIVAIATSFFFMSLSLRSLPMGTVYAVWTGIGAVGGVVWGIAALDEPATVLRLSCVGLILAGLLGLKLGS